MRVTATLALVTPPTGKAKPRKAPAKKAAKRGSAVARRPGRPLRIHEVVDHREGQPVTIGEQIVRDVQHGNYVETAAAAAGLDKATVFDWMRRGARLRTDEHEGRRSRFTKDERALMEFSTSVAQAQARAEADDVRRLDRLGQGGLLRVVETVKVNAAGNEVERSTRTESLAPDAAVLQWRLERRFGARWGRQVAVTGADGGPVQVDLGRSAREILEAELDKIEARLGSAPSPTGTLPQPAEPTVDLLSPPP